ncbi:translation initiation factor IF-1 [[Mycoplasma] anseris]|uniref:Translation initiation factor IF-1 n=1 Tax=[Mycoplasma] anseris TaxID=92400 RepID=A0A2Z4NCH0_9BACT|nr:translation initiation factor IF-1 [[Mycoplasma] anseris]AWX69261.1 translation initiation factor IF-1 [[Mycoplasma] anseris]
MAKDVIKVTGTITKMHSSRDYDVLIEMPASDMTMEIKGTISGKMALNNIKMIPGDKVDVKLSPFDMTRGRIVFRHK